MGRCSWRRVLNSLYLIGKLEIQPGLKALLPCPDEKTRPASSSLVLIGRGIKVVELMGKCKGRTHDPDSILS